MVAISKPVKADRTEIPLNEKYLCIVCVSLTQIVDKTASKKILNMLKLLFKYSEPYRIVSRSVPPLIGELTNISRNNDTHVSNNGIDPNILKTKEFASASDNGIISANT